MKRNNGISPLIWAIGVTGIALTIFLAWNGLHSHPASKPPESTTSSAAVKDEVTTPASAPAPIAAADEGSSQLVPVPLVNIVVPAENDSWNKDKDYLLVPHTAQEFGGIPFLMDGLVQLQGQISKEARNRSYRTSVLIPLPVTNAFASVHLLGGTRYGDQQQVCAQLVWHYEDGSTAKTAIENLTHLRDWVRNPYEQPAHLPYAFSKVVWTAPQANRTLRLYRLSLPNPEPKKVIRAVEFVSEMRNPTLFLVAVTMDTLKPGERPDNTADLEPFDAIPPRTIQIVVTDPAGTPLPNSHLQIQYTVKDGDKISRPTGSLTTDANGIASVGYPPQNLNILDISASHENYAGRKMDWNLESGDQVPASYTLKLTAETTIGATVVDSDNHPISGATISLYRFWSSGEDGPYKKGEQSDFRNQQQKTGPDGHWRATGLPSELIDHISFQVKHPDFLGTNFTVGADAALEKQLRAETFKIVLNGGTGAQGFVTDEAGNPIAGATVWAGRKYYRDRQDTKTDAQGQFHFQHVSEGDTLFSVMAKGHEPGTRTVAVKKGMQDIVFKLGPGHVIRGVVQDESGSPIPDVRVALEGPPGDASYDAYEFSANTDSEGKFSWDGTPAQPMQFYFGKQGYEQKRNVPLIPDQDSIVTLRAPRQLNGLVLDANTGQPVTKFSVRIGQQSGMGGSQLYGAVRNQDFNSPDGRFTIQIDEAADNAVQAWADDYALKTVPFSDAQNGVMEATLRLDPSAALKGIVTTSEGVPVPGANVVSVSGEPGGSVQLQGSHIRSFSQGNSVATTDDQGAFSLGAPPEHGTVVAVADAGYVSASVDEVRASHTLVLQAFGRIEGTLKIAGVPGSGQDLLYNTGVSGMMSDFNSYKTTTDDQGHFSIERIPPGDGTIVRLIKTTANSWTHSYGTSVTVQPGQTTQVNLGDSGALLRGTVRFETPPTNDVALTISGTASTALPPPPRFNSSAEAQAFMNSPEWKAQMKLVKNYAFVVTPGGTFQVDSVTPGSYTIRVTAQQAGDRPWANPPVAQGSLSITVPDNADPMNPIPVGEIVLKPQGAATGRAF